MVICDLKKMELLVIYIHLEIKTVQIVIVQI